jgi:hypothetical protein
VSHLEFASRSKIALQNMISHYINILIAIMFRSPFMHKVRGFIPCVVMLYHMPLCTTHVPIYGRDRM